jgi:hypothetical protein
MDTLIKQITNMTTLEIPKTQHDRGRVVSAFGGVSKASKDSWFVPCSHALSIPADAKQLAETELTASLTLISTTRSQNRLNCGSCYCLRAGRGSQVGGL